MKSSGLITRALAHGTFAERDPQAPRVHQCVLPGIIERVGTAPRVIADCDVQLVLPASPNPADGTRLLHGARTKYFVMSAEAGPRPDVAIVQLNGSETPAALMLLWMAPYPPFASAR